MSTAIRPATPAEVALRALTPAAGAVPFFDSATTADLLTATATELNYMAGVTSAVQAQIDAFNAAVVLKGVWDASAGTFPGAGAAQAGWSYIVSVGGTVDGVVFVANDRLLAILDNASTTVYAANWHKLDYTDQVLSVAGKTGVVTLDPADIGTTASAAELNFVDGVTSAIQTQLDAKAADSAVVHDTGDEVVAGVKTFSSDPLVPDEVYGVGWNGSMEPPTKNAVYDKIEALGTVGAATETTAGIVELATNAETVTGTDTARAVTPANVTAKMAAPGAIGGTTPGPVTATQINLPEGGAVVWDGGDASLTQTGDTLAVAGATFKPATGTATMVPVKFTSGTVIAVTEAGSVEFNGDIFYGTITTGAGSDFSSQYPPAHSDTYVKDTSTYGANYEPYFATDPAKPLTGSYTNNCWLASTATDQSFHMDLGSLKIVTNILYHNLHGSGGDTNHGVESFTFWGSNDAAAFADTTYATDTNWTSLTTAASVFNQHVASDVADPKNVGVTNSTGYRYYRFKFADNHGGGGGYMGVRRIELQEGSSARKIIVMADGAALVAGRVPIGSTGGRLIDDADFTHDGDKLTSRIQLPAGSASLAPFRFTSGTFLTTPLAGAVEFLTDDLCVTITTGTARKTIAWIPAQTNATGSRALDTTYTAPATRSIQVTATVRCAISLAGGNAYAQVKSDGSTPPTTIASGKVGVEAGLLGEDNSFQISFVVAAGAKYRIDSSATNGTVTLGEWFETSF